MSGTRIAVLAAIISTNTTKIDDYLKSHGLPPPSFHVDHPADLCIPPDAIDIDKARKVTLEASIELQDLLQGPTSLLQPALNGTSLQAIYKYGIAFKVPIHGSISYALLAARCNIPEGDLQRIMRFAMVWHRVFCEPENGFVAHTAASRQLAEDPRAHDMAGLMFDQNWQAMARTVEAMQKFRSHEPNETGFALANDTQDNMFDWLGKHPAQSTRFNNAISTLVPSGNATSFLTQSFDWASLGKATVVDVGGAQGAISVLLAEVFPNLHFVVQDLPEVILGGREKVPAQIALRIEFVAHDFFTDQPTVADVYFLRAVLHNWPNEYCIKILRRLVPALRNGAKIVLNEGIVPEPGTLPFLAERSFRTWDMLMMTLFNAHERDKNEWIQLLRDADVRFRFIDAKQSELDSTGLIVAEWVDHSQTSKA